MAVSLYTVNIHSACEFKWLCTNCGCGLAGSSDATEALTVKKKKNHNVTDRSLFLSLSCAYPHPTWLQGISHSSHMSLCLLSQHWCLNLHLSGTLTIQNALICIDGHVQDALFPLDFCSVLHYSLWCKIFSFISSIQILFLSVFINQ